MSRGSDNKVNVGLGIMIIGIPIGILMIFFGQVLAVSNLKSQAIEKGYALYCPKDRKFAWKGECE